LSSKGRNYTLSLKLYIDHIERQDVTILSGADSALMLTPNITLFASGNHYRLNSTLPLKTWVNLSILGRGERTFASVRTTRLEQPLPGPTSMASPEEEFQAVLGVNGESFVWAPIAIEAPIAELGGSDAGWSGEFAGLVLSSEA
jgi:hexosaminidase